MRGIKILFGTTALLAGLALAPAAQAQIYVNIGVQPVCAYGYYDYAPYACAPYGFYGPGYFYNGIFLGMGPWAGWGYGHGWGGHRFSDGGGGSYHGGGGAGSQSAAIMRAAADSLAATLPFLVPAGRVPAQAGLRAASAADIGVVAADIQAWRAAAAQQRRWWTSGWRWWT